jgi:LysR family hydrogen peroxide-inducible transcriptional activator
MTLTQLEYVVALERYRHFALAAEKCFITQPTLSMQIQKLEEELGVKLFDRTKQPVIPTEMGELVVAQARKVLWEAERIPKLIEEQQDILSGELRLGIIPTLAPYLLPALYATIREKYPQLHLHVKEMITEEIVQSLKNNWLDCGLVVTPLEDASIKEDPLFFEELYLFVSETHPWYKKASIKANELQPHEIWLLEEGHCFRSQVIHLCASGKDVSTAFKYESGSLETLKRMVLLNKGMTVLPQLAVNELPNSQRAMVKKIQGPVPVRQVSLVTHRDHVKTKLIQTLREEILLVVPPSMKKLHNKEIIPVGNG